MTDITDQDRRAARVWAKNWQGDQDDGTSAAARVILATVDAPEPTLAESLHYRADLLDNGDPDGDTPQALRTLAARAAQMERDLTEARAKVEHPTAVQKGAESNAETPDPADVKPGEAWTVECHGETRTAVKDGDDSVPWLTVNADDWFNSERNTSVTLVSRLVPAPRTITDPDDLDALPSDTTIIAGSIAYQRVDEMTVFTGEWWYRPCNSVGITSAEVLTHGPATVVREPEA